MLGERQQMYVLTWGPWLRMKLFGKKTQDIVNW